MKKVSITILLILPFILIYFISFMGIIINKFGHIAAETISVYVQKGTEWVASEEDAIFRYDMDLLGAGPHFINIQVRPTEANNRAFTVFNTNEEVSHIDVVEDLDDSTNPYKAYLTLISNGTSHYTVASEENPKITYSFYVSVEQGDLKGIRLFDRGNPSHIYTTGEMNLPVGRTAEVGVEYLPRTTREEFKDVTWTFSEELDFMSPIRVDGDGKFVGLNPGDITATVTSNVINKDGVYVSADLLIHVTERSEEKAYFNFFKVDRALVVNAASFDFKSEGGEPEDPENQGKILFNDSGLSYDDVNIRINGGESYVDQSMIEDLVLKFTNEKAVTVNVELYLKSEPGTVVDRITLYVPKQSL